MRGSRASNRRYGALAAAKLVGLALISAVSGCEANPEPPPLTSPSSSPSPTESPSATSTPPPLPPDAQGTSEAAAKAFVEHWIDVLNYAGPAGDAAALRDLSDQKCAACTSIADFIDEISAAGGQIEGDGWSVLATRVVSGQQGKGAVIDATVDVASQIVTENASASPEEFNGGRRIKTFWLERSGESWLVTRLDQPQ